MSRNTILSRSVVVLLGLVAGLAGTAQAAGAADGYGQIRDGFGKCVAVPGSAPGNGTRLVRTTCNSGAANQRWLATQVFGRVYTFTSKSTGKCIDVNAGSLDPGAPVQIWTCNGTGAQEWDREFIGLGPELVFNYRSGLCLDSIGNSLMQWTCRDTTDIRAQQWIIG
ncbi:RICIN domain-containing protein [Actinoplanes ianthinogenes]|nr:RICIN domain-containing protein [Actinoplanes ianthinogenes]